MRAGLIFLIFFGLLIGGHAQKNTISSIEVCYGYKMLNQNFKNNFNTLGNFKLAAPLQTIGLSYNEELEVNVKGHFFGNFYYNQIIPQAVLVNGLYKCNVTGFTLGAAWSYDLFGKAKNFDLMLNAGFNTGRLRFYGDELTRQKNPYFAPKIGLQPKIRIKKIAISLTVEYDYDISKSTWRKTLFANSNKVNIDKLSQTGLTAFIGIGYAIN